MNLDRRARERGNQRVDRIETLLAPPETDEGDPQRLFENQVRVGRAATPSEPDRRAVLDDLDPVLVELVDAEAVVGGAAARESPVVDDIDPRRRARAGM